MFSQQLDLSLLNEEEQKELLLFYQFLIHKSKEKPKELPQTFYQPLKIKSYSKFDRNEIYIQR